VVRTKKTVPAAIGLLSIASLLVACSGAPSSARAGDDAAAAGDWDAIEPIELTVSSIFPKGSTSSMLLDDWMKEVTKKTEGKVTFDFHGDATLHPVTEALSALQSDLTDITFTSTGYFPDQLPIAQWDDILVQNSLVDLGYPNVNIAGIAAGLAHYGEGSIIADEFRSQGFRVMLPMVSGPAALTCTKPFKTPDDLAGRQVRVPNAVSQGEHESLGMKGVFTPPNEQYEALQRGVLDCAVNASTTVTSAGLLEVAPYATFTHNAPSSGSNWVISSATWDSLPPQVRQVFDDARYEALANFAANTLDSYKEFVSAVEKAKGEIVDPAPLDKEIVAWRDKQPSAAKSAPDGVDDPEAAIERMEGIADDWQTFTVEELGVEAKVSTDTSFEEVKKSWEAGSDIVDWDAWAKKLAEYMSSR
jgi:TRAP-type C4-dicarboxylate transport system substrate-binding protein